MKVLDEATVKRLVAGARARELDTVTGILVRMKPEALAECKALVWLGQGRELPKYWDALVAEARARLDRETILLLAEDAAFADNLAAGLQRLDDAGKL